MRVKETLLKYITALDKLADLNRQCPPDHEIETCKVFDNGINCKECRRNWALKGEVK